VYVISTSLGNLTKSEFDNNPENENAFLAAACAAIESADESGNSTALRAHCYDLTVTQMVQRRLISEVRRLSSSTLEATFKVRLEQAAEDDKGAELKSKLQNENTGLSKKLKEEAAARNLPSLSTANIAVPENSVGVPTIPGQPTPNPSPAPPGSSSGSGSSIFGFNIELIAGVGGGGIFLVALTVYMCSRIRRPKQKHSSKGGSSDTHDKRESTVFSEDVHDPDAMRYFDTEEIQLEILEDPNNANMDLPLPPTKKPAAKKKNKKKKKKRSSWFSTSPDEEKGEQARPGLMGRQTSADVKEIYSLFDEFQPGERYETSPLAVSGEAPHLVTPTISAWERHRRSSIASSTAREGASLPPAAILSIGNIKSHTPPQAQTAPSDIPFVKDLVHLDSDGAASAYEFGGDDEHDGDYSYILENESVTDSSHNESGNGSDSYDSDPYLREV
jgi:hypothetical protein